MNDSDRLAERFEAARPRLRRIGLRMLGSGAEADDALQEAWLRVSRADIAEISNFEAWLTTVVARVCLDALKRRESRREQLTEDDPRHEIAAIAPGERPEEEAMLADSIGVALLILLDALPPAERVAFVLHDLFDVPFDDIGAIVGRTTEAARQLASRARRRVRGASGDYDAVTQRHDELVRAFFEASRAGNFSSLLALLDPARHAARRRGGGGDGRCANTGRPTVCKVPSKARDAVARMFSGRARAAQPALIDGKPGAVWMRAGEVQVAFYFTIENDRIKVISLIGDRAALERAVIER